MPEVLEPTLTVTEPGDGARAPNQDVDTLKRVIHDVGSKPILDLLDPTTEVPPSTKEQPRRTFDLRTVDKWLIGEKVVIWLIREKVVKWLTNGCQMV